MSDTPIMISICCITYNQEAYVKQCLDGFMMQQMKYSFEVIIHDDASTDKTAEIIQKYADQYPDIIKPIFQTENQYCKGNGILIPFVYPRAQGKYIALCEGDDYWTDPLKLQKQVDFLEAHPDYGMCYTNFDIYNQKNGKFRRALFTTEPELYPHTYPSLEAWIARKGYVAPMTWLFRSEARKGVDLKGAVDGTFVFFAHFLHTTKVHCIMDVTAVYRQLAVSASHTNDLQRRYNIIHGLFVSQIAMIEKYGLSSKFADDISFEYYQCSLKFLVALNLQTEIKTATCVLQNRLRLKNQILLLINKVKLVRTLFSIFSKMSIYFRYK